VLDAAAIMACSIFYFHTITHTKAPTPSIADISLLRSSEYAILSASIFHCAGIFGTASTETKQRDPQIQELFAQRALPVCPEHKDVKGKGD
jgi:hypothetical protein